MAVSLASYIEYYLGIEAALRESEERSRRHLLELQTVYRTAPIGLALVDRDLRFLRINDKLAEINGMPVDAHIGRTLREVVPSVADTIEPLYRHVIETGQSVLEGEVHGTTAAQPGIERDWLVDYYPMKDPDGSVQGVAAIVSEITGRKRVEEALRRSEKRFRDFAAAASDWFWETDAEHRFVWMSENVAALTGVPRESQYGKTRFELMAPGGPGPDRGAPPGSRGETALSRPGVRAAWPQGRFLAEHQWCARVRRRGTVCRLPWGRARDRCKSGRRRPCA